MSTEKNPEFELNQESSSELGPEELGEVSGGFAAEAPTSASCCIGCNTLDTVTSGCKNRLAPNVEGGIR
jgi:hypothetical protein